MVQHGLVGDQQELLWHWSMGKAREMVQYWLVAEAVAEIVGKRVMLRAIKPSSYCKWPRTSVGRLDGASPILASIPKSAQ